MATRASTATRLRIAAAIVVAFAAPTAPAWAWPAPLYPAQTPAAPAQVAPPAAEPADGGGKPPAIQVAQVGPARCVVNEIRASNDKGGIDPALAPLEAKLKRPPFSSWDTFKLLARHDAALESKKTEKLKLVTGGKMSLLFRDRIKAKGSKPRVRISVTVDNTGGQRIVESTMVLDSGDDSVIGGWPFDQGTYLIALSCTID